MMQLDPGSMLAALLRLVGAGGFLVVVAGVLGASAVAAWALVRRRRPVARLAAGVAGVLVALWGLALLLGPAVLGGRLLAPGDELAFCGLDCDLHVAVTGVRRDSELVVTVRARSDAKRVTQDPSLLRLRVRDAASRRWDAEPPGLVRPLGPGESYEQELRFRVPAEASGLVLVGGWRDWAGYLVPGPDHPAVQERTGVPLERRGPS